MIHRSLCIALAASFALALPHPAASGQGTCPAPDAKAAAVSRPDIVDTAVAAGSFKTLLAAAKAAGLVDALKAEGPITLFAPTDEAFGRLPAGTVDTLLRPENRGRLAAILRYHVVPGCLPASVVVKSSGTPSLEGQIIPFRVSGDEVSIGGARAVKTDIMARNGIIHVIDAVLIPTDKNLVDVAAEAGTFSTLLAAARAAGLAETLQKGGPFTLFAPTDEAFRKLPAGTVEDLLKPENHEKLARILKLHVVSGRVDSTTAAGAGRASSLEGGSLRFEKKGVGLAVNGAQVTAADVNASNGLIHVIDSVILPQ